jgi:hypothetical protein
MRRSLAWVLWCVVLLAGTPAGNARDVVQIVINGQYFSAPADVRFMIAVEPDESNRMLRIEAEGDHLFRASEVALNGADEKRLHNFEFKNLPAGSYTLRAVVRSTESVRGMATRELVVTGIGLR